MRKRLFVMVHLHRAQWMIPGAALLVAMANWVAAGETPGSVSPPKPSVHSSAPASSRASAPKPDSSLVSRPQWTELTPAQQLALQPLHSHWGGLSEAQKRKWLVLSKNYPSMPGAEQAKLQGRMTEWVTLSSQQRTQARLNYAQAKTISPAEKQEKWQAYQALSPEEKNKLASKQPAQKGAASVVKPDAAEKLTLVPTSPRSAKPGQKIAAATHKVDQKTLLPRTERPLTASAAASAPQSATVPSVAAPNLSSAD